MSQKFNDEGFHRRKYPRRSLDKKVGVLCRGTFFICDSEELGEGGMSVRSEIVLSEGAELVVSFQIPSGHFVSLRAQVRTTRKEKGHVCHGLAFTDIQFTHKRQIRSFVSSRNPSLNA